MPSASLALDTETFFKSFFLSWLMNFRLSGIYMKTLILTWNSHWTKNANNASFWVAAVRAVQWDLRSTPKPINSSFFFYVRRYVSQSLTSWVRQQKNTYLYSTHMAFTWWRGEERTDIETDFFSVKPIFNTILVDVRKKVNGPIGYLCYGCQYGNTGCRVFKRGFKINIHKENYWILRIGIMGRCQKVPKIWLSKSIF